MTDFFLCVCIMPSFVCKTNKISLQTELLKHSFQTFFTVIEVDAKVFNLSLNNNRDLVWTKFPGNEFHFWHHTNNKEIWSEYGWYSFEQYGHPAFLRHVWTIDNIHIYKKSLIICKPQPSPLSFWPGAKVDTTNISVHFPVSQYLSCSIDFSSNDPTIDTKFSPFWR